MSILNLLLSYKILSFLLIKLIYCQIINSEKEKPFSKNINSFHKCKIIFDYDNISLQAKNINKFKLHLTKISEIFKQLIYINDQGFLKDAQNIFKKCNLNIKNFTSLLKINDTYDYYFYILLNKDKKSKKYYLETCAKEYGILHVSLFFLNKTYNKYNKNLLEKDLLIIITQFLGFNTKFLSYNKIMNNFLTTPFYLNQHLNSHKSFLKYYKLIYNKPYEKKNNYIINRNNRYTKFWNFYLNDYMSMKSKPNDPFSEITTNLLEDLPYNYHITKCELITINTKCYKSNNQCINLTNFNNKYFMEYNYHKNKVICYLNNGENIKKGKCNINYGSLVSTDEILKDFTLISDNIKNAKYELNSHIIPETNLFKSQTLYLLRPNKLCPKIYPRTIIFINRLLKPENYLKQEKFKNYTIDEVKIKDKKYFVTIYQKYIVKMIYESFNNSNIIFSVYPTNDYNFYYNSFWGDLNYATRPTFSKYIKKRAFPVVLCNKKTIQKLYHEMQKIFPNDYNFMFEGYLYPEEKSFIIEKFKNYTISEDNLWIVKPNGGFAGRNVHILDNIKNELKGSFLLSKYFTKPFLINGYKVDVRYNTLITGLGPLRIYLYKEGIVRKAANKYSLNKRKLRDKYTHLTNACVGKHKKGFRFAQSFNDTESGVWTQEMFENYLNENGFHNYTIMKKKIIHIILLTIFSMQHKFAESVKKYGYRYDNFFQLIGFDILFDQNFETPYVVEYNQEEMAWNFGPYLNEKIYNDLIADTHNIMGSIPFSHDDEQRPMDDFIKYNDPIEEMVDDAICEFGRPMGGFTRIFPLLENIDKYEKYVLNKDEVKANERLWKKMKELHIE